jgi:hypothetical protein
MSAFGIYVTHPTDPAQCGYFRGADSEAYVSPWPRDAWRAETMAAAQQMIADLGFVESSGVVSGRITGYVCNLRVSAWPLVAAGGAL